MAEDIFIDGVSKIQVLGGAARIEFFAFLPSPQDAEGRQPAAPRLRLIMAPETLRQLHVSMSNLVEQFIAHGLLQRAEPPANETSHD